MSADACGVMVTFHPDAQTAENVERALEQLDHLLIVDNGSHFAALEIIRKTVASGRVTLIENGDNRGIASALNRGVRVAMSLGYPWVLLLDQDSTVTDGLVRAMLDEYDAREDNGQIALIAPVAVDRVSGLRLPATKAGDSELLVVQTSGSLMRTSAFSRVGFFEESLFIDGVDYEHCLRLRKNGLKIISCPNAFLTHSLGRVQTYRPTKWLSFSSTHHNAKRRYYITRNRIWVAKRYWKQSPCWCLKFLLMTPKDLVKLFLVENDVIQKFRYSMAGLRDGILGRMGKTVEI